MKGIFVFISCLLLQASFAQVTIVRDPLACAYGLKNKNNQWVVPAQYQQLLLLDNNNYACQLAEKWGIVTRNGKTLLDPVHDNVSIFFPGKYLVTKTDYSSNNQLRKVGLIDTAGTWVFPQEFASIQRMQNLSYCLVKSKEISHNQTAYQSSFADENGTILFPFVDGCILSAFYQKPTYLVGSSTIGTYTVSGNVRIINDQGAYLSDSTYDMGMPCGNKFIVTRKGKYGLLDSVGNTLIAPSFHLDVQTYNYENPLICLHGHHQVQFFVNNLRGVINGDWKVIIPPTYVSLNTINSNFNAYTKGRYIGKDATSMKYNLLSEKGELLFQADSMYTKAIPIPKSNYYEQDQYNVYYVYRDDKFGQDKWGVIDGGGIVLLDGYDKVMINNQSKAFCITAKGTQVPAISLIDLTKMSSFKTENLHFYRKIDSLYLFKHDGKIYPLVYVSRSNDWELDLYSERLPFEIGDFTIINGNYNAYIINNKSQEIEKVSRIDQHSGKYPIIYKTESMNLLHPTKGKLFHPDLLQVNQQFASENRIWGQQQNGTWKIYDTVGKVISPIEFNAISYYWDTMIVQSNFKKGLLDEQLNWLAPPIYSDLFLVTKNNFVGITPGNHVTVINTLSKRTLDTTYNSFTPLVFMPSTNTFYFSLKKNGESTIYDQQLNPVKTTEKELLTGFWTNPLSYNMYHLFVTLPNEKTFLSSSQTDLIYSEVFLYYQQNLMQNNQFVTNGIRGAGNNGLYLFKATPVGSNRLSLVIEQPRRARIDTDDVKFHDKEPAPVSEFFFETTNWLLVKDEWRKINFNDLFQTKNQDYRTAILAAIEQQPSLKINCNEPTYLFEGARHFSLTDDGVILYFFAGESQAFELKLSKEQLAKIASAKWIVPYL